MANLPVSVSDPPPCDQARAYEALHPEIRRWVREQKWSELRQVQADAIAAVLGTNDDVLITAATAAGKTEAAFLPALTQAAGADAGLAILYVAPLKALINDQYSRLGQLCERLELPLVRWHGDAPQAPKSRLLANPRGVALITPESIEALLIRRPAAARGLLARLRFLIVDEVHAFLGTTRGVHLASLLRRIDAWAATPARRIGLSATIGDLHAAAAWLRPERPDAVRIIAAEGGGAELLLQVRGYQAASDDLVPRQVPSDAPNTPADALGDVLDHLFSNLRGKNNLVFAGSRKRVESVADRLRQRSEDEGVPNEFYPHHGNLSKELREELEQRLKLGQSPTTAVCTSTLELGIDIGSVTSVAQIGAPRSIAALRQRLGRSGRRGAPAVMRVYVLEDELGSDPNLLDEMRTEIVRATAAVRLLIQGFVEPSTHGAGLATALLHQSLSVICQRGGIRADALYKLLCGPGPFAAISAALFVRLLRAMGASDPKLIEQAPDGLLMLGGGGERLVESHDFYALFESAEEWRLVSGGKALGTIPLANILVPGNLVLFAGRRWVVLSVDEPSRLIEVGPHRGGAIPAFERGSVEPIHDRLAAEMRAIYGTDDAPAWLDKGASDLLRQGRAAFRRRDLDHLRVLSHGRDTHLFTWRGTQINTVLVVALSRAGLQCEQHDFGATVCGAESGVVRAALEGLADGGSPDASALSSHVIAISSGKFDALLPDGVLREFWAIANGAAAAQLPHVAGELLSSPE